MYISENERKLADNLISLFIYHKDRLPYANVDSDNNYAGWVSDFGLQYPDKSQVKLDLNNENDLFLLFVLSIVWSRTGPWENSAFFVAYLKEKKLDNHTYWSKTENYELEESKRVSASIYAINEFSGFVPRRKISFRKDIYRSINVLAVHWQDILDSLKSSEKNYDFHIFIRHIRKIEGLGVGNKAILKKIVLILRELRCQKIYKHISGDLCCVTDKRVYESSKELGLKLPLANNLETLISSSSKIYALFGDLYDLPLFAYNDLKEF